MVVMLFCRRGKKKKVELRFWSSLRSEQVYINYSYQALDFSFSLSWPENFLKAIYQLVQ